MNKSMKVLNTASGPKKNKTKHVKEAETGDEAGMEGSDQIMEGLKCLVKEFRFSQLRHEEPLKTF